MKKKGFCFKRTVSLLLAAAMILTAAPQTSLTTLAAEQGMTTDTPDVSEGLDILTTEDGTSVETGDTEPSKSEGAAGQDGTDASGDIGDESADVPSDDGAGDHTEDPDGINQDDDAGDSDETADPEEGMDEDLTTDDESVSGNDLEGVMSVFGDPNEEEDEGPAYKGVIDESEGYRRLIINEEEAKKKNVEIADILAYYAKQIEADPNAKFNCVELQTGADSSEPLSFSMKKDYINGARSVMDTANEETGCWIDYSFWNNTDEASVTYTLRQPHEVQENINATCTVERISHQGVKINVTTKAFPAESVGLSYSKDEEDAFADCWGEVKQDDLRLLALDDGAASSVIEQDGMWYNEYTYSGENGEVVVGSGFGMDDIEGIQAGQDYLITPMYWDEDPVPAGTTKTLTAGERSGSSNGEGVTAVTWKSLDEALITIEAGEGAAATLTAKDEVGEACYCVTYQSGGNTYLELRAVRTAATVDGKVLSYVGEIREDTMEDGENDGTLYRRLLINEYEAIAQNDGATIADILTYYAERINAKKCEKFNCVELNVDADSSSKRLLMKKENINGARSIMDTENEQIGYWIDYNFWNEADKATVCYTLSQPDKAENDIDATFTVTPMSHQGVKINAKTTEFPTESFGISYNKNQQDAFAECWDGAGQEDLRLLAWNDGAASSVIEQNGIWYDEYTYPSEDGEEAVGSSFGMDIAGIEAEQDYLITPVYADEDVAKGSTRDLTAGERSGSPNGTGVTEVTWKSLDEELITIAPGAGADAKLTATDTMGEAYYYVTYKRDSKDWFELHRIHVAFAAPGGSLNYIGKVEKNYFEDGDLAGTPYLRLIIDEAEAAKENSSTDITPILKFYKDEKLKVNCVELNIVGESLGTSSGTSSTITPGVVKKDYIDNALSVMDRENDEIGHWIDYNFWNEKTETGVNFTLGSPYEAVKDVNAAFTLTDLANKGLKVKFADTAFPAESVSLDYNQPGVNYEESLWINNKPFRLFTHSSGTPKDMVDINEEQGWGYYSYSTGEDAGTDIHFNNIKPLGTTEYLAASIYEDEDDEDVERPVIGGKPVQLKAGTRADSNVSAASAAWKLFDTDKATIDKNGNLTAWSDQNPIYYYVTYKVGSAQYLEVHEINAQSQDVEIKFDESEITMEMEMNPEAGPNSKYLRLRFYPSDAECDLRDPERFRWEITKDDKEDYSVIDFVYYYYDKTNGDVGDEVKRDEVKRDDDGKLIVPEGTDVTYGGDIIACSEGKAKVTVSYLSERDENGKQKILATAECTVNVVRPLMWEDKEAQIDDMNRRLYAVTDVDTKLSDVKLDKGWEWEDPDTLLANFKGMNGCQFPAVYKDEDEVSGKTFNASLWVRFVTVTGIEIDGVPDSIGKGDKVTLRYSYRMDNLDEENEDERKAVKAKLESSYQIEWTSNPANAGTTANDGTYQFTAPQLTKAQKYTFTVSVKDMKTNKVILKNSCAVTVTVTENPVFDWNKIDEICVSPDPESKQMFLRFNINGMTLEEYRKHPLKVESEDPAILKLQNDKTFPYPEEVKDGEGNVLHTNVVVPCTNLKKGEDPKPGTAWIKMTAADEIKSTRRFCLEFIDKEPKLMESAVTINQALEDKSAEVKIRTHMQYPIDTSKVTLQLDGKDTSDITATVIGSTTIGNAEDKENSYNDYNIKLELKNPANVKKGKNKVTLKLVVNPEDSADTKAASETYPLNLTLNVINTVPKVTFKQAKKVNLFYKDEEGDGILNVNVTGTDIKELKLDNCDFEVKQDAKSGEYRIAPKANVNGSSKKGKLSYKLGGCSGTYETNFTVSTENKKPTIVLSQKSDTLYPMAGYSCSWLRMSDKATGDDIVPDTVTYVDKKAKISDPLSIEKDDVDWDNHTGEYNIPNKADYNLLAVTWGGIAFMLQAPNDNAGYKKKTDKFSLEIQNNNWNEPVTVSYSIKVDTAKPKLVLGKSTLTLNKNSAVYRAQQERTSLHLKGTSDAVYQGDGNWVRFDGQDDKSREILRKNNSLVLQYWEQQGDVIVRFNDNSMQKGTYKFKVSVGNEGVGLVASTVLTVKIVDVSIDKTLKVTAKGSIDVMNREGTSIAYTPKISNISGKVVEGRLEGMDSDLFENWWDGSKLIVKARYGTTYNTKHTYRVRAVFEVDTEDYENLTVSTDAAKPLTIKLKQGKPKLTASTAGNTIYRQLENTVDIKLSAMLNKQEVNIEDVRLLNFTDDFKLKGIPVSYIDENGNTQSDEWIYNPDTKSVRLGLISRYEAVDAIKSGKPCKVKLAVRYCDQAGNEKEAQVTCSIVVR